MRLVAEGLLSTFVGLLTASCGPEASHPTAPVAPSPSSPVPSALDERGVVTPVRRAAEWQVLFLRQSPDLPRKGLDAVVSSVPENSIGSGLCARFRFASGDVREVRLRPGESIRTSGLGVDSELMEVGARELDVAESRIRWWMR